MVGVIKQAGNLGEPEGEVKWNMDLFAAESNKVMNV